jgi:predicted O-methyltransferase YrrM
VCPGRTARAPAGRHLPLPARTEPAPGPRRGVRDLLRRFDALCGGRIIGSELHPGKADRARGHLERAGLGAFAEIRTGDAREQLTALPVPVDLVLLDGWKELYLPVLKVLEPALRAGSLIVSDNLPMLPPEFTDHVRTAGNGYLSQQLPLGDGIEFSLRLQEEA